MGGTCIDVVLLGIADVAGEFTHDCFCLLQCTGGGCYVGERSCRQSDQIGIDYPFFLFRRRMVPQTDNGSY